MMHNCMRFSLFLVGLSAAAQSASPPTAQPPAPPPPQAAVAAPEESLTAIVAVPYCPTLKRDPFTIPSDADRFGRGDSVDDIGVKGRVISRGKVLVVVSDSRGNVRTLSAGYKFKDGEIAAITEKAVVFHQWDISSTNKSVYRTIVKPFKTEEGKP